jgi:hypothetical protein
MRGHPHIRINAHAGIWEINTILNRQCQADVSCVCAQMINMEQYMHTRNMYRIHHTRIMQQGALYLLHMCRTAGDTGHPAFALFSGVYLSLRAYAGNPMGVAKHMPSYTVCSSWKIGSGRLPLSGHMRGNNDNSGNRTMWARAYAHYTYTNNPQ